MEKTIFEMHQLSRKNVPTMKKTTLKSVRNKYGKTGEGFLLISSLNFARCLEQFFMQKAHIFCGTIWLGWNGRRR